MWFIEHFRFFTLFTISCILIPVQGATLHNSGYRGEGSAYSITNCNTGSYYVYINAAFYGYSNWCSSGSALSTINSWCHGKSSCTVYFYNSYMGDPCPGYSKSGYVKWYCAQNGGWSDWSAWTTCSLMCGTGTKSRTRSCNNPSQVSPGSACSGSTSDSTSCNTGACPTNQLLTDHRGPWRLVFKAPNYVQASGYSDVYSFYAASGSLNDGTVGVMRDFSASGSLYKSSILDNWGTTITISAVRLSGYRSGAEEVYIVFNAFGKTKLTWMNCNSVIDSTWTDVSTETKNFCGMADTGMLKRNFYINRAYGGCTVDTGWFMLKDYGSTSGCSEFDSHSWTLPFVRYGTASTYVNWASSTTVGHSMAIFVLEWHMVFKGIQGVTSAAGSLEALWEGSTTENDDDLTIRTLTTAAGKTYKSNIVEKWSDVYIELVKYAFFTSGAEKAWVVFDGRSTTKNSWFTDSKILYSRYTDLTTSMTSDSISGDGTRAFALIRSNGACSAHTAWMFSVDNPSGAQTCSWDQNVQTRPYFLYSSGTTYASCESGGNWNSGSFPAAETMGIFIKGWYPVMKFARGQSLSPASSVYNLWTGTYTLNDHDSDGQSFTTSTKNYKSAIVDSWTTYYIKAVRVSFFVSGVEKAYVVFDAHGSDKSSWFNCDKILYTSYNDLNRDTTVNFCSVYGENTYERRFFLEALYNGCDGDAGWFGIMEDSSPVCSSWETKATVPFPLYSDTTGYETNAGMAVADVFAVSVDMENYCSTITCLNGATCYERGVIFDCVCDGDYYGIFCADRDGVWTDWTAWTTCSTTCYAQGTQTRTRTCTNPSQAGAGTTCAGDSSETLTCIPDFRICSTYNTGTLAENTQYTMVCPDGYHIVVSSAFYGLASASCSDADATHSLRTHCSAKTSCTFAFSDAYFADACSSQVKEGYATMYCRLDVKLTQQRGPWRLVFKAPASTAPTGYTDLFDLYSSSNAVNDGSYNTAAMRDFSSGSDIYKSSILQDWGTTRTVSAVKASVIESGVEAHYVIFNGFGKTKTTFWDCDDIIESSWIDIKTETKNMCTMEMNTGGYKRNFFINRGYGSCTGDTGWLFLKDYGSTQYCSQYDTLSNVPYIMYAPGDTYTTFASNREYADALAIYVLEWQMVFKGIEGVVPAAGSLETLWEGSDLDNDENSTAVTLTTAAGMTYKSGAVEMWSSLLIDQVKYSYFTSGTEVAYVVFDGLGTTKNNWFASTKILYSRYTDIITETKSTASISGDGTRQFALIRTAGACSAYLGWMLALDNPSGAQTCSWDKNVKSRPYFLYSSGTNHSAPESNSAWNSGGFPAAEVMGIFFKGWLLVFKWANTQTISPATSVHDLWTGTYTLNEFEDDSFSVAANSLSFKSSVVDSWSSYYISAVRVSFYSSGIERVYVVFDAHSSTKTTWMTASRILYSSYTDLHRKIAPTSLGIDGDTGTKRRFLAQYAWNTCSDSYGWFGIMERDSGGCAFESKTTRPYPMYSDAGKAEDNDGHVIAEAFSISLALEDYVPCSSSPCQNAYNCFNRGPRFQCNCTGSYYGMTCDRRDGGWSDWSAWAVCTTTCYAYGTQTRFRNCTNPTLVGSGIDCQDSATDTITCLPDFAICPVYNTGDLAEGGTYTMICPSNNYIIVDSAYYGNSGTSCSDADSTYNLRTLCHRKSSCSITFNDALFGDPCPSDVKTARATMKCAENQLLTEDRGPWTVVFKIPSGQQPVGYADVLDLYMDDGSLNDGDVAVMNDLSSGGKYFKSALLGEWGLNRSFSAVRLSVYKSGKEAAYVIFDAKGKNKTSWMDCENILDSSYIDIQYENQSICDLIDTTTKKRSFFISKSEVDCTSAQGWMFLKDYGATTGCNNWDSTSVTMPYIVYSTDSSSFTTWETGSKAYADSMVISVLEWDMVFKGVEGVVPAASSLKSLWEGSDTSNDLDSSVQTVTQHPSQVFKSKTVEDWQNVNIDMAKYSLFDGGSEVAWVVFDGRGTTKTTWFADSKILYSSYLDLASGSTVTCGISGDGTRSFSIIKTNGACSAHVAWMLIMDDASASKPCSWDNNVRGRPYFLYSNSDSATLCETGGSWASASFPAAENMAVFIKGWYPVLKFAHGQSLSPASSVYDLWTGTYTLNDFDNDGVSLAAGSDSYKSSVVDSWANFPISAVRVSFYKAGVEKAYVVFDALGSDKNSWFDCDRILYTSWDDLSRDVTPSYCSVAGHSAYSRYFHLQYETQSCTNAHGWFGIIEHNTASCSTWEAKTTRPYALYSDHTGYELNSNMAVADVFAISIPLDAMDDICDSSPCQNNGTCFVRHGVFECVCNGTFYGMACERRDGNWTEWTAWATCSTTCWALGSHSRTRNCTNPYPVGAKGIDCSGIDGGHDTETKECIPDLHVCPLYSTGTITTASSPNTYRMVCPTSHYTVAISASFGHTSCSDSSATNDLRWYCDGKVNCTFSFSNTVFGSDCSHSSTYGSATLKCVEHMKLTEHRGPWRLVFKAPSGTDPTGFADIVSFYEDSGDLNDGSIADMVNFDSGGNLFKSSYLHQWGLNISVSAVRLSVIKSNTEVGYVIFDARGKNKTDWMDCDNILDSSWVDIAQVAKTYCHLRTDGNTKRHFYIAKNDSDCDTASGWLFLKDNGATEDCSNWDKITSNVPFIVYSKDTMAVDWTSGNKETADALAIYVMEWEMVFKGVEGQVPTSASSLENLWEGSTQENVNDESFVTLTTTPNKPFKSLTVDQWTQFNIEMVKYSYFTSGYEVAYVVFDGRGTSKNDWFDSSKVLYSNYLDIPTLSKAVSSISGDGVRAFALIHETSGTCSAVKAWMMAVDKAGGSQTCSWDKNIRTRPYFVYSSNYTWSYPDIAGSWSEASFPTAETMGVFIKGWFPVMKAAHGQSLAPATGIYNLWTGTHGGLNEFEYDAFTYNSSSKTLRSSIIDSWQSHYIKAVRISFYVAGTEKAFVVFDAHGTDKNSWFACNKILYSSYGDLNRIIQPTYCSIAGQSSSLRYFLLAYHILTCADSYGWFGVAERTSAGCTWDTFTSPPFAFYSDHTGYELFSNTAVAEVFAISVELDDYCASAPCENNATCYDRGTQFECICNGTFYGMVCEHRDGNWTEWSAWATCSTTCWALGSHSRTRTCTNPFPVGSKGLDCSGIDGGQGSQTKECIPDLPICPEYNTGNIFETASPNTYRMVCPLTHFTMVMSAFYGHNSCTDSNSLKDLRWLCDGNINCTIPFTDGTFGNPCPSVSNYGNAVLKCVEHIKLTEHRGPWRLVFKVPSGVQAVGYDDVASFYAAPGSLNDESIAAMTDFSSGGSLFKSSLLDDWETSLSVSAVRYSVYKSNVEVAYIVFDAMGKGKTDWMDCDNVIDSSWVDLAGQTTDVCAMNNTEEYKRNFFVSKNESDCATAKGWLLLKDYGATSGCSSWDSTSSPARPYILYSKDKMSIQWSDGNKGYADALAVFIMEWDMIFKGVQGVVPAAGSLKTLWEGSGTENEDKDSYRTVTKDPGKSFKSLIVQQWENLNIETVKYAFFNDGKEVAWVVFDGRSTTKNTVFDGTNILYSRYLDIPTLTKAVSSIAGDGIRTFELVHEAGPCANFKAWMMVVDTSGSQTCSWDKNIQTRPYFIYSNNYTWSYPEESGSWNSVLFPTAESMGIFIKGWFPVLKYAHGQGYGNAGVTSILDMWTGSYIINEFDYEALNYNTSSKSYKSSLPETWANHYIKAVKVSFHSGGQEKAFAVFDGHNTNKNDWFDCSRLLYTSYNNLNRHITPEFCSIAGETSPKRHFLAQYDMSDCANSYGWFGMIERTDTGCSWETKTTRPYALYSDHTGYELNTNMAVAEVFAISVALDNYCDSSPCKNNATCYNRETTFECICNGTFYGMDCAHRDGNWSEWAPWGECSTTCYFIGTHTRTRACTDPTPVGDGLMCVGNLVWEIQDCYPDLQVCASYDSGNISEGNSFKMVCPNTHYIYVDSGWYGNDAVGGVTLTYSYQTSYMYYWKVGNLTYNQVRYNTHYYDVFYDCIDDDAVHDLRAHCHRKVNCTIEFGQALFKEDPCPTKSKHGNVQMQCVEHNQLTEFRGPWRVVFKASAGVKVPGYTDLMSLYMSADSFNDDKDSAMNDFSSGSEVFKSSHIEEWNTKRSINAVRYSVFKNNKEVGFIVFDAWNKTKTSWMDCTKVLDSSWKDLILLNKATFCGLQGDNDTLARNLFVSKIDTDCSADAGWVMLKDYGATLGCDWDSTSSPAMPYIMYSPNNHYVNWTSADAQYADSLAISVLEWNMAFKGVQGVTSAQGSLESLWNSYLVFENEDDATARTVTKSPGKIIKEKIIDDWDDWVFLELAKYSFFNSGQEVAYTIFDTRGDMSNTAFFTNSKIVFSSYEDIKLHSKSNIGISGDGVRKFLLAKDTSSCSNFDAWMFALDAAGGSTPCSFDNNVVTRPYFLYSDTGTVIQPQSGGSWDSTNFPSAEVMAIFLQGWFPVMGVTMGQSLGNASNILDLWTGEHIINEWDYDAVKYTSSKTYKSSVVDSWSKYYISSVRVSYFKASVERAYAVFDAHGSDKNSWFDCSRLLYTNYYDLSREVKAAYCGITGHQEMGKHFFIEYAYNNCSDYGWFGLIENTTDSCAYVGKASTPFGLFSDAQGYELNNDMEIADKIQISVALRGYCESSPCKNGATCYDRVGRFDCVCPGTFYGMTCLHRDGNWTEWTSWDTCTTTCYAVGTQERYRNCTNPTTEGDGIYCANEDWQIQECIPSFPICPVYNTGDMNSTYKMVCPWDHYIYVDNAWWGATFNGSTVCSDSDATTDLKNLCHGTVNCTFTFSTALFSQPCTGHLPYGNAKLYCARDGGWTNWEAWTWCPVTCAGGLRERNRYCTNPTTISPGQYCPDHDFEDKACLTDPCPVCGNHKSGYDDPANISVYQDTTSGVGFLMLDVNWEIHCCEVISAFEFVPSTDGEIDFLIWRKVSSNTYKVINSLNYTVNGSEIGTVVNITLPLKQRLAAAKDDVIGWYTSGQNMINYAPCQGELCPTKARRFVMTRPSNGDIVDWLSAGKSSRYKNRAYAFRFYTHPNEVPFLNQTIISMLAKDSSPIGTSVLDYNIQDDDIGDPLTHSFTHELFELNTTFEHLGLMHFQTTGPLPSKYKAFQLIAYTADTCHHTSTTTLEVITYNAPPVFHNLPNKIELSEATITSVKVFDVDVKDYSDNDSVCCTLAQVVPGSLNFDIKFINETYSLWTSEAPVFDYSGISNYYKLWVCCSDQWGVTANFLEIDVINVISVVEYIPPTWFLTAIGASMVPIALTFLLSCAVMCSTFFCDAEIEYYYE